MRFDDEMDNNTPKAKEPSDNEIDIGALEFDDPLAEDEDLLSLIDEPAEPEPKKPSKKSAPADFYGDKPPKKEKPVKEKTKSKKPLIITLCSVGGTVLLAAVVCLILFWGKLFPDNKPQFYNDGDTVNLKVQELTLDGVSSDYILATGIKINGSDVGGMTLAQARRVTDNVEKSLSLDFSYTVNVDKKTEVIKSSDLHYEYNTENVLATLVNYTESLGKDAYKEDNPEVNIEITCDVDKNKIDSYIAKFADKFKQEPKDAEITAFHPWEEPKFEYAEGTNGLSVDTSDFSSKFYELYNSKATSGSITPKSKVVEPKVTVDFLKKNIIGLSSFWTYSVNSANGNNNMKIALERSNGAVVKPGEVYSFAHYSGDTNSEEEGYLSAIVYQNGESVLDTGGGACQAATTIYDAAVYANMEVVEREGHIYCSDYTASGFDATISYGAIDVKLRNKTDFPMYFETKMEGTKLTCNIYGYQDPSFDDIATYSYNYDYYSGESFSTRAYRIYLKDGVEVDREFLDSTTYSLQRGHYVVDSDPGTIGARPGGEERSVNITPDEGDVPLYDHNNGNSGGDNTPPPTDPPTEPPTEPPTQPPTEAPTQEPTEPPTEKPTDAPSEPDTTDPSEEPSGDEEETDSTENSNPQDPDPQE